jgi:hypothetical protein
MKAIVNVKKNDGRALYNGKTYDVRSLNFNGINLVSLNINGNTFNFTRKEVIIVDIVTEAKRAFKFRDEQDSEKSKRYYELWGYIKENKIVIPPFNMLDCKDIEWEPL